MAPAFAGRSSVVDASSSIGSTPRARPLARSLALAGIASRDDVRAALEALGEPLDVRAERLAPERLRELWERVGA